jgi:hypothetical protein
MAAEDKRPPKRLIQRGPRPKRLSTWIVPLVIVVAIIIFLPKLLARLE